ncbi:hypothetical protein AAMO2058_001604500 [Amorphochlora amoebiformis]
MGAGLGAAVCRERVGGVRCMDRGERKGGPGFEDLNSKYPAAVWGHPNLMGNWQAVDEEIMSVDKDGHVSDTSSATPFGYISVEVVPGGKYNARLTYLNNTTSVVARVHNPNLLAWEDGDVWRRKPEKTHRDVRRERIRRNGVVKFTLPEVVAKKEVNEDSPKGSPKDGSVEASPNGSPRLDIDYLMSGWLDKKGASKRMFKSRHFRSDGKRLRYFLTDDQNARNVGHMDLDGAKMTLTEEKPLWIMLCSKRARDSVFHHRRDCGKKRFKFTLRAATADIHNSWTDHFRKSGVDVRVKRLEKPERPEKSEQV